MLAAVDGLFDLRVNYPERLSWRILLDSQKPRSKAMVKSTGDGRV